jgi:glycosyltransferase involved in cell wall biosynthesis
MDGATATSATASRPSLCIVTQYYVPELGAPQTRLSELATRLTGAGWDVTVLTAVPNYPMGKVPPPYKAWRSRIEDVNGVKVCRVPLYPASGSGVRRMLCFLSFAVSAAVCGTRLAPRPDLLLVESPPLTVAFTAWALQARWRRPYVLNVSDLWPGSAVALGALKPGPMLRFTEWIEKRAYDRAIAVTGQSREILSHVATVSGRTRCYELTNGVDPERFGHRFATSQARSDLLPEAHVDSDLPVFVFAGLIGMAQGLDQVLAAAKELRHRHGKPIALFSIIGDGPARRDLQNEAAGEGLSEVAFLGARNREDIPALLASADAAIITLGTVLPGAIPSKIYEAMASELPIVLVAAGEANDRVDAARAGISLAPGDVQSLADAVERLADDPMLRSSLGANGAVAADTTYNRDRIAAGLDAFLRTLIPGATPLPPPTQIDIPPTP